LNINEDNCGDTNLEVTMRIISFNVNGVRSMLGKVKTGEKTGTLENNVLQTLIEEQQPDLLCFQEIKTQSAQDLISLQVHYPHLYTTVATEKKGYSGVALLSKTAPDHVEYGFDRYEEAMLGLYKNNDWTKEGRLITTFFPTCIVVTVYTPNAKQKLERLEERLKWEGVLRCYVTQLQLEFDRPLILCGDLNCAYQDIDIYNPKGNAKSAGFTKEEREEFGHLLAQGFTDSFRHLYPDTIKYSYWSNFRQSRQRNIGWRIDYILVSMAYQDQIRWADCLTDYKGSDHCPVVLEIDV